MLGQLNYYFSYQKILNSSIEKRSCENYLFMDYHSKASTKKAESFPTLPSIFDNQILIGWLHNYNYRADVELYNTTFLEWNFHLEIYQII